MYVSYVRPPRVAGPAAPRGDIALEPPAELPEASGSSLGQSLMYLPMLAGGGAMSLMWVGNGATPTTYLASGLYGISSLGMVAGQLGRGGGDRRRRLDGERRDYLRYLAQTRRRLAEAAAAQRTALCYAHPDPVSLWSIVDSPRLWERRPGDEDFTAVRVAVGAHQPAVRAVAPETKLADDLDPVTAGALRRFLAAHATIADLPFAVSLRAFARVSFPDGGAAARALVRAMLAQLAVFHAPDDLLVVVCVGGHRRARWEWLKWLPHALHPERVDRLGPLRLLGDDLAELERLFTGDLEARPRFTAASAGPTGRPHLVVVLDEGARTAGSQLAQGGVRGVTVLDVAGALDRPEDSTDRAVLRLKVSPDALELLTAESTGTPPPPRSNNAPRTLGPNNAPRTLGPNNAPRTLGRPDTLRPEQAEALARQLSPIRLATDVAERPRATDAVTLTALLGIGDPARFDPAVSWAPRAPRNQLRIPIGLSPTGTPVELDLKESAMDGMGPHGMVIGATGSGKSELLRTLVLGLAVTHSSEVFNLVLVDFKGGATFLGLDTLPHVSAVITNLSDELPLVDRMYDALHGELVRRQELLRRSGTYASLRDYERARLAGSPLEPLPTLLIVVDEFSELLAGKPEFAELFLMIGRLGRSLGVHLLLASQRLDEGRLRGLGTHLSYRIALRTFSAIESRSVIGVSDAYELPPSPGHGYLLHDNTTLVRFKAGYVSAPHRSAAGGPADAVPGRAILDYSMVALAEEAPETVEAQDNPGQPTLLDVVVSRLRGRGPAAHQVWLPPLGVAPTLDELLPTATGSLRVPVGLVDKPFEQRRDPLWTDLAGAAGHVAVVGAPRSGKSIAVASLLAVLAATHSPEQVQFYALDLGGGALAALEGLPHLGGLARRQDAELVRRTMAEIAGLLERRERKFADAGVTSMADVRRQGSAPDVFLIIDGWLTFGQEYEGLDTVVTRIAGRGLGYGIHVVLTANRWAEFRPALRELLGTRLELRLGEPFESEVNRRAASNVPERTPGRGITPEGLHFLTALPRLDATPTTDDLADGMRALAARVATEWAGTARAARVRTLPRQLELSTIDVKDPDGLVLGLDEQNLAPVVLHLDAEPHLTIYGDTESGKTNLLRLLIRQVVRRYTPAQARLIVVDYRRGLLDAVGGEHQIGYAASPEALGALAKDLSEAMRERLPGPNLTTEQLRDRSWWQGAELYLVVDDYELVESPGNPLAALTTLLPHGRDIGLHLLVARAMGGVGRAQMEPLLRRVREMGCPGLMLSGNPEEGSVLGKIKPQPLPPGRGVLVTRREGARTIQTALAPD
jgi:S-DNA-T family DNA segregation ATPase FtsK/SpoIIIE